MLGYLLHQVVQDFFYQQYLKVSKCWDLHLKINKCKSIPRNDTKTTLAGNPFGALDIVSSIHIFISTFIWIIIFPYMNTVSRWHDEHVQESSDFQSVWTYETEGFHFEGHNSFNVESSLFHLSSLLGFPKVFNGSEIHSCFRWYMLVIRLRTLSESTLIVFDLWGTDSLLNTSNMELGKPKISLEHLQVRQFYSTHFFWGIRSNGWNSWNSKNFNDWKTTHNTFVVDIWSNSSYSSSYILCSTHIF